VTTITLKAPAKVNLGLRIIGKRDDGYHEIDTIMIPIGWHDIVRLEKSSSLTLTCSDPSLPTDKNNLVLKAAMALQSRHNFRGASIHLIKNVPHGAGLGSGSSDAGATLRGLRTLWDLDVSDTALRSIAATLGSDVPFFVAGRPARARGRGEVLEEIDLDLEGWILVVVPRIHISTSQAYSWIDNDSQARGPVREIGSSTLSKTPIDRNDFQSYVTNVHPEISAIIEDLRSHGATYVSLSGSGSSVFGIFETRVAADRAKLSTVVAGSRLWLGHASEGLDL